MVFRSSDTSPKEVNIYHGAGARGSGGSSYIDAMILRDFDSTGDYESGTADGVLQDRYYHCQNWRQDTAALVEVAGASTTRLSEQVRYSAYGMPFGLPKGDADVDGETKVADETQIQTWISGSQYLVRGDVDLDGDVDTSDKSIVSIQIGAVLGRTKLSTNPDNGIGNRHGYASYQHDRTITRNHVRHRVYDPDTGRWTRRDPAGYVDGPSSYAYARAQPASHTDSMGLMSNECTWCPPGDDDPIPEAPCCADKHVWLFEGLAGWAKPDPKFVGPIDYNHPAPFDDDYMGEPFLGFRSPSEVAAHWFPLVTSMECEDRNCSVFAHYSDQSEAAVSAAVQQAIAIATENACPASQRPKYPTIVATGFSNGGDAAIAFANALGGHGIRVDLGFTADPIPRGLVVAPTGAAGFAGIQYPYSKPDNTSEWSNYYQRNGRPFKGNRVMRASNVEKKNCGHMTIVLETAVDFEAAVGNVPCGRESYEYKRDPGIITEP